MLRRKERASKPSAPAGLGLGDHQIPVGRAFGCQGLRQGVRGVQLIVQLHSRAERLRIEPFRDLRRVDAVRRGDEPVAPIRAGFDLIAVAPQLLDALPDGIAADAQLAREALAGKRLLLRHQRGKHIVFCGHDNGLPCFGYTIAWGGPIVNCYV